ncbi:dystroglycan 1 [Patella vulgata]|uniref:dystroglycan 1 n=1 Tax=Patella vulgata TaxID=6465 RepID=UPI00217F309A|nr:dystroglycan 1 [Patella vulgata]
MLLPCSVLALISLTVCIHGDQDLSTVQMAENDTATPTPLLNVNDGLPDATAYLGRIFEYSLADNAVFGNSSFEIKVSEAIGSSLPGWLLYNSNRRQLIGVPSTQDVGDHYISVETVCTNSAPCFKDVFLLSVKDSHYGFKQNNPHSSKSETTDNTPHGCENEVVITNIVFCVSPDKLEAYDRIKLISDMSKFLSLDASKLMLIPSTGQKLRALEDGFQIVSAGPGNAGLCDEERNVELSWEISCSTLKHIGDFVSILQHNIKVGRIQKESGVEVVGWYIASSNSLSTTLNKRKRRRAWRTPVPTPVLSPVTPTRVQTTSTIVPTTSFNPSLTHTVYHPGNLPTIQIAFRSTESASASTSSGSWSRDQILPTQTKTVSASSTHVPYESMTNIGAHTTTKSKAFSPSIAIHSSSVVTPTPSGAYLPTTSYIDPEIPIHSGSSGESPGQPMETKPTTMKPRSKTVTYTYSSSDLYPSTTDTTASDTDPGYQYTRTKPLLPIETTKVQTTNVVFETTLTQTPQTTKTSTVPTTSSIEEGSANDAIEGSSSSSGDQIEEGSTPESGDSAIYTTDDEDDLKSRKPGSISSSGISGDFSSSLIYLPYPDEGGIVFENQPTDIVVPTYESSSRSDIPMFVTEATFTTMSSSVFDLPNFIPLFPNNNEGTGDATTHSQELTSHTSGSSGVVIEDDKTLPPFSGQGRTQMSGADRETYPGTERSPFPRTDWGTASGAPTTYSTTSRQNIIIEDMDSGSSSSVDNEVISGDRISHSTTAASMSSTTNPKPTGSDGQVNWFWERISTTIHPSMRPKTTFYGYGPTEPVTLGAPQHVTESTTRALIHQTHDPITETSTLFSKVTAKQNNNRKNKNKKKNKKKKNKKNKTTTADYWDWKTLPANMTTPPTVWPESSASNHKPYLENSIDYIEATLGEYFEYQIPRNVFYDIEDGDTQSLQLSLSLPYNQPLPPTFWLQLDPKKQIIKGLPLAVDLDTGYQNINLIAKDKGSLTETDSIKLFVNSSTFGKFSHKFIMTFGVDFATFMNDRSNLNNLLSLIASYFGDDRVDNLTVLDVSVGSLIVTWTNNTLNGDECDNSSVNSLLNRMVRKDGSIRTSFTRHFGKDLPVQELEYQASGACAQTTTTMSYTTFLPEQADTPGLSIWAQVVLPVMVSLLVLLLIILLVLLINRRRKKKPEPTAWDKPVFNNDRNPIIFPDELEREEASLKPKKPTTLSSDVSGSLSSGGSRNSRPFYYFEEDPESNDSTLNSERSRTGSNKRPPKAPPPYWQPHSEPPPYRLPPPYAPAHQTNV